MSKISYCIVRTFDVKHHAAHGTIVINFGSERGPIFSNFNELPGGFHPPPPGTSLDPSLRSVPPSVKSWIRAWSVVTY